MKQRQSNVVLVFRRDLHMRAHAFAVQVEVPVRHQDALRWTGGSRREHYRPDVPVAYLDVDVVLSTIQDFVEGTDFDSL